MLAALRWPHAASLLQEFHEIVAAAGRMMFIKEGTRIFSDGSQKPWSCCLEAKGLKGIGGKKIMMEAFRTTPLDPEWLNDARRLNLRPELVRLHNAKARSAFVESWLASLPPLKEGEPRPTPPEFPPILFNINCFAGADAVATPEEEADVRALHKQMMEEQVPQLLARFAEGSIAPLDGFSLVEMLHTEGINVRWVGSRQIARGRCHRRSVLLRFTRALVRAICDFCAFHQIFAADFQKLPSAALHRQHRPRSVQIVLRSICDTLMLRCAIENA